MAEYIEKNHFDERIRIAVGMCEGDVTSDFKDGVLFVLNLLKSEEIADVIPIPKGATNGEFMKIVFPDIALYEKNHDAIEINFNGTWWNAPYQKAK